ncbi:MAG: C39 family peptidase [Oscillospiraceae bacterium]|nr:C39 family peptidase [Oscillospiraceae bacterium]
MKKIKIFAVLSALILLCSPLHAQAELLGDLNSDGELHTEDVLLLKDYLHGKINFNYQQYQTADLNHDHTVNIFDLCLLKQKMIYPPEEVILDVPEFNQHPDWPTGCESAALYMLLHYYDVNVSMEQIVEVLPKGPLPYTVNGKLYGANPEREFVGHPSDSNSYGVFNRPIASTAVAFRSGVNTKKGASLKEVILLLNQGTPVMVWYASNPEKGITYRRSWYDYETGEFIQWPSGEHAVVVCGHDADTLTYRDPNTGSSQTMKQSVFQTIFDEMGGRILYFDD